MLETSSGPLDPFLSRSRRIRVSGKAAEEKMENIIGNVFKSSCLR